MALDVYQDWLGIPDGPRPPDHYTLLRLVPFEDELDKVRQNYKKLNAHVRKYASGTYSVESQELLNELARAMLCLTDPERKREYDEGRGRTFDEAISQDATGTLLQVLAGRGALSADQVREAESYAEKRGLSLRDAVVQMKLVDHRAAAEALAEELGLSFVDLDEMTPDDSVLDRVPRDVVKRNTILPLFIDDDMLLVACVDETGHELEDELRLRFGLPMRRVIATPLAVNQGIARYYAPGQRDAAIDEAAIKSGKSPKRKTSAGRRAPREPMAPETRRQLGIIIICWSILVPALLDIFVVPESWIPFKLIPFLLTPICGVTGVWWVLRVFWKK